MKYRNDLTVQYVRELFYYNPETGDLTWKKTINSRAIKNKLVNSETKENYLCVTINKTQYFVHRIAWLYMTGKWPKDQIDHINKTRNDNRWCNLREATNSQNQRNRESKTGTSKYKGVHWNKESKKWVVQIGVGSYKLEKEAALAYNKAALKVFGNYAHINKVRDYDEAEII